jgi:hypothetical protein
MAKKKPTKRFYKVRSLRLIDQLIYKIGYISCIFLLAITFLGIPVLAVYFKYAPVLKFYFNYGIIL